MPCPGDRTETAGLGAILWGLGSGIGPLPKERTMPAPLSTATRTLGERIRTRRKTLGLSQEALADQSDLHWTFVGQVERGRRNISLHNLLKIAAGLEVDAGELVQGLAPPSSL
jgi:ribosome-binding protein aMBF1 (putative translation factor)